MALAIKSHTQKLRCEDLCQLPLQITGTHSLRPSSVKNGLCSAAAAAKRFWGSISKRPSKTARNSVWCVCTWSRKRCRSVTRSTASFSGALAGQSKAPSSLKTTPSGISLHATAWRAIQCGISRSRMRSIIAKCSMSSCTVKGRCPRYSIAMIQPALHRSEVSSLAKCQMLFDMPHTNMQCAQELHRLCLRDGVSQWQRHVHMPGLFAF
mmetsp:Transcript_46036/g.106291  ORF Transcript_46036/g.106291 Transcript_46036/m.106291 type:complete len:209 (-) Transcript_46036:7-633(-)